MRKYTFSVLLIAVVFCCTLLFSSCDLLDSNGDTNQQQINADSKMQQDVNFSAERYVVDASPNPEYKEKTSYIQGDCYYYVFYLGTIMDVPLQELSGYKYSGYGDENTLTFYSTETTSTAISESAAYAATNSTSWMDSTGETTTAAINASLGGGEKDFYWVSVEASISETKTSTSSTGGSNARTSSESYSYAENKQLSKGTEYSVTWNENNPKGYYRYVYMGKVDVFATIVYSVSEEAFHCQNDNYVSFTYYALDYSEDGRFAPTDTGRLVFNVPELSLETLGIPTETLEEINDSQPEIKQSYTITFNSMGGSSLKPVTGYEGDSIELPQPTKANYLFAGWQLDGQRYSESTIPNKNISLTAQWLEKTITKTDAKSIKDNGVQCKGNETYVTCGIKKNGKYFSGGWYYTPKATVSVEFDEQLLSKYIAAGYKHVDVVVTFKTHATNDCYEEYWIYCNGTQTVPYKYVGAKKGNTSSLKHSWSSELSGALNVSMKFSGYGADSKNKWEVANFKVELTFS